VDATLMELARREPRYSYEAYQFVCDAVNFTQERLGRMAESSDDAHVNGEELLRGACEFAVQEYGLMAPVVFKLWGVRNSDDIGDMVFRLIEAEKLSKSENDAPDDFRSAFDLDKMLADQFENASVMQRSER